MRIILIALILTLTPVSNTLANALSISTSLVDGPTSGCPSGYKAKDSFSSTEIQILFKGKGEFMTCLNQYYPDKNNYRDSWGINYGESVFQCGNISVQGYLGNLQQLQVKSSVGFVTFRRNGYESNDINRSFCKKNTCFTERSHIQEWAHWDSQTFIEQKYISRNVFEECTEVTF